MSRRRRGSVLVEFTLTGIPVIFLTISIIEASLAMWQYHSMAFAVDSATRYAIMHGRGCAQNGNTCTITVGNLAHVLANQCSALDSSKLNVTLKTKTGTPVTCNPLNMCFSDATQFPDTNNNGVNLDITIVATYPITNPLPMFWPGSAPNPISTFTLGATSRQRIVF